MLRRHALYPTELRARVPWRRVAVWAQRGKRISRVLSPSLRPGADHFSGTAVARRLEQPTRGSRCRRGPRLAPAWPCSGWGLPCDDCCQPPGALLPHPFTLACDRPLGRPIGGLLSVALSSASRRPGVTRHPALWSSDFPRPPGQKPAAAVRTRFPRLSNSMAERRPPSAPGRIRTPDLLIRSQTLYPAELRARPARLSRLQRGSHPSVSREDAQYRAPSSGGQAFHRPFNEADVKPPAIPGPPAGSAPLRSR